MSIFLNAFPLKVPKIKLTACQIPYEEQILNTLRVQYKSTHAFRRQGENILIFSMDGTFPVSGSIQTIALQENYDIFLFLVKDGLIRDFSRLKRRTIGFNPIDLISVRPDDNLLLPIFGDAYPIQICAKYSIDTRTI